MRSPINSGLPLIIAEGLSGLKTMACSLSGVGLGRGGAAVAGGLVRGGSSVGGDAEGAETVVAGEAEGEAMAGAVG